MEREEFTLVRDMLRAFATRFRTDCADGAEPQARAAAQRALDELGLTDLRRTSPPAATVQECALLAEEHGRQPLTTSLLGTALLAPELRRLLDGGEERSGAVRGSRPTVALAHDLRFPGPEAAGLVAWDCEGADTALCVDAEGRVTEHELGAAVSTADLLRSVRHAYADGRPVGRLTAAAHQHWQAYAVVVVASEVVGAARSFTEQSTHYARERHQYGQPIGSFQAVQHLLADATVLVEAGTSATRHAAWCVDHEASGPALTAARVAKAEVDVSAVEAVYAGMQVFGGIAQTWEHVAHLYLRRVLAGTTLLATTADLLPALAAPEATP